MAESTQDVNSDAITQPTKMAEYPNLGTTSIVEEMRKTGTMTTENMEVVNFYT